MVIAASYPLLEVFWTMLIFFGFVIWLWILFTVLADIFRRHDASAWVKVLWIAFVVVVPYLGVFTYVIVENRGMAERSLKQQQAAQAQADEYIQAAAGRSDPAQQIANAKQLLDSGTITQSEFDGLKRAALAS
ncbi:MAG TPA: SHOCT domain-containing protein [Solirubrobacteraceae bacterium]|nr:SHOCT domain-containing protein [Solirubrobacteraceae bacterium]